MTDPEFYLASSEGYGLEEPRACKPIKRLRSKDRDDLLLVFVDPPIIGQPYGLGSKDIDRLIISPRHQGESLFPIARWPVYVHVARLLIENVGQRDFIDKSGYELIAWAELYATKNDAVQR